LKIADLDGSVPFAPEWAMPTRSSTKKKPKPKREGTPHDFTTVARRVVEQAIGEKLSGDPLDDPDEGKNPARVHQTLRVTPAIEAGIADHVWSIEEIVKLLH
jgi:hypothetical protein